MKIYWLYYFVVVFKKRFYFHLLYRFLLLLPMNG